MPSDNETTMDDMLTARPRILIVDPVPMSRTLLEALLCTEGRYDVLLASSGAEGLNCAHRSHPDLLLLDTTLGGDTDSLAFCRTAKSDPRLRRMPVVLLTAQTCPQERARGLEAGADDFLGKPFSRVELLARVRSLLRIKALNDQLDEVENVIYSLSRVIEAREGGEYEAHTERVVCYATALGRELKLNDDALRIITQAVMLRDLGKIGLPDKLLNKRGSLNHGEQRRMQAHAELGAQIISPLRSTAALMPIVRHHHERVDGKGYPDGLAGDHIPLGARIVAIADAFDAMLSHRPYRPAIAPSRALATLQAGAGKQWDTRLVELFVGWAQRQPVLPVGIK